MKCPLKGWKELLLELMKPGTESIPEACPVCLRFLKGCEEFNLGTFQQVVAKGVLPTQHLPPDPPAPTQQDLEPDIQEGAGDDECVELAVGASLKVGAGAALVEQDPYLVFLEPGTNKCKLPVQCQICVRKGTGQKAIFDLVSMSRTKYVRQHLDGPTHEENRILMEKQGSAASKFIKVENVPCCGFCPDIAENTKVHDFLAEFKLWSIYNACPYAKQLNEQEHRHSYSVDLVSGRHCVFHHSCEKLAAPDVRSSWGESWPTCKKCRSLANDKAIIKMISRFWVKHAAARCLVALWSLFI